MSEQQITVSIPAGDWRLADAASDFFSDIANIYSNNDEPKQEASEEDIKDLINNNLPDGAAKVKTQEQAAAENEQKETPPPPATNVELDEDGLPWDAQINVASRAKVKDGTWKIKQTPKGMNREEWLKQVAERKTELRKIMSASADDTPAPPPAEEKDATPPPPPPPPQSVTSEPEQAANPSAPPPPPPAEEGTVDTKTPEDFPELMAAITARIDADKVTEEQVDMTVQNIGLTCLGDFVSREDLIPKFIKTLRMMTGVQL